MNCSRAEKIIREQSEQIAELQKTVHSLIDKIGDLVPNIGNNNNSNNTNIIVHLNTNYPNAIPIQELCVRIIELPKCVTHNPKLLANTIAEMLGHQTDDQRTIRAIKDTMYIKHQDTGFKADETAEVFDIVKKKTEKDQLGKASEQNSNMFHREKESKEYPEMVSGIMKDLTTSDKKQMKNRVIKAIGNDVSE